LGAALAAEAGRAVRRRLHLDLTVGRFPAERAAVGQMTILDEAKQIRTEVAKLGPDKRRRFPEELRRRLPDRADGRPSWASA
jgi:hypothetical protein